MKRICSIALEHYCSLFQLEFLRMALLFNRLNSAFFFFLLDTHDWSFHLDEPRGSVLGCSNVYQKSLAINIEDPVCIGDLLTCLKLACGVCSLCRRAVFYHFTCAVALGSSYFRIIHRVVEPFMHST